MTEITERLSSALADRYRLERHVGEGGMATVYLAHDARHDRKVAVKVLRPELAAVLGAERFVQEIRTTAGLQHPHILPLFDSGSAGGFLYYVMPYIQGETLREKLNRETQLSVDEAVRITREVADALDYAHRHDVIHRDIKPENILLHDGRAMVADFGIALAVSAAAGGRMTETGLSLGTPHYMSPEQATADRHVTSRSDIYSLGCVLYEMLTGEPPHTGSSAQAIILKIVTDVPRPVTDLRRSVPSHVAAAVSKALEKLPADRFESARAFADALANPAFTRPRTGAMPASARPARLVAAVAVLATIAVAALVFAAWGWLRPRPPVPLLRYAASVGSWVRDGGGVLVGVALSPDGSTLVFRDTVGGRVQLFVKRREDLTAQPLAGTDGAIAPFYSPDGEWIGFFAGQQLRKVASQGGGSLLVADSVSMTFATGIWLEDGSIVYADLPVLRRVPASGGRAEVLVSFQTETELAAVMPNALPAGRGLLFTACSRVCNESSAWVYDARRDSSRLLYEDALGIWYAPTGHVLHLSRAGTLVAASWDNDALVPNGPAVPILDGVQAPGFQLSADGTALYVLGPPLFAAGPTPDAEAVWVDRQGQVEPVDPAWRFNTGGVNGGMSLSPDGRRLAIRLFTALGSNIWVKQLPAGPVSRLTFYEGEDRAPKWTPDGRAITFFSDRPVAGDTARTGHYALWTQAADGTGDPKPLWRDPRSLTEGSWSGDGRWLVLRTTGPAGAPGGRDILAVRPGVDTAPQAIVATAFDESAPALSPDSRWLAYVSNETGRNEVFIRPFPDVTRGKWQASNGGGNAPVWAHSGRELFFFGGGSLNAVEFRPGPPVTVGQRRVLFPRPEGVRGGSPMSGGFDITPDDRRFIMVRIVPQGDTTATPTLVMVQNFFEELKAKVGK